MSGTILNLDAFEQRFRNIFKEAPFSAALISGDDFVIEMANEATLVLWGKDDSIIGKPLLVAMPEMEGQDVFEDLRRVYKTGEVFEGRERTAYLNVDGNLRKAYVNFIFKPIRDEGNNKIVGVFAVGYDVTDQVIAKQKIEQLEARSRIAIDAVGLGTFEKDLETGEVFSSKRFNDIFGFRDSQPHPDYISKIHPDDAETREAAHRAGLKDGSFSYEARVTHDGQTDRFVKFSGTYLFDSQHKPLKLIGTVVDVTDERVALRKLQDSEQRFRTLITETPEVGVALYIGPEITIQFVNEVMLRFWGKNATVVGKTLIEALPETADQPFYEQLREVYGTGITHTAKEQKAVLEMDGRLLRTRYYNYTYKALRNASGKIYGVHHMAIDVTDEVFAKQQVIQSEESVRTLFMQAPVGIGVLKGKGLIIDLVNDAMLSYWKRSREEVINRPLWDVFPEIAQQGFEQITEKVFTTGESYFSPETPVEMLRHGNLDTLYISFSFEPLRDQNGNITGMLTTGNDVTDHVIARKKSETNEARLQNMADSMPQLVWIADENGEVTYYNKQIANFEGAVRKPDGMWEWKGIVHPDDEWRTRKAWSLSVKERSIYQVEHRIKMSDGTLRWHLSRAYPQADLEGKITWYGTATDIQQMKDAEMAVRESEERFRIMADATPSIIWALTPDGMHRYLNRFALEYLGVKPEDVETMQWNSHIHPDDVRITDKVLRDAIHNQRPYSHEHRLRRHDGQYRWFLSQGAPTYHVDGDGELYGYVGSATEIHDWKLAQELLRKNEEMLENTVKERTLALQRSNDDLQQFAHVASHDLKEPIRKIKTFSYKLQDEFGEVLSERGNSLLNKIISSTDRMFGMINGVLTYSAVSSVKNNVEHVDLNNVVNDVKTDLELLITEKKATIRYGNLPSVQANTELIHQLFYNLINNSLKFSRPQQDAEIEITSRSLHDDKTSFVEITLSDNGIGFDNEYAAQIFGTFVRLHSKDQYEGTGLGLALCKRIIERYGGTITAEGKTGIGSIFRFTLPT